MFSTNHYLYIDLSVFIVHGYLSGDRLNDYFTPWMRDLLCRILFVCTKFTYSAYSITMTNNYNVKD